VSIGIILVHGYTGSSDNLKPLAESLAAKYNNDSITNISLPGHGKDSIPLFQKDVFIDHISSAVNVYKAENRKIILLGHSTGGVLLLASLLEHSYKPHILILASTPKQIDMSYLKRWQKHTEGKAEIPLSSIANMISLIKLTGSSQFIGTFPVLIIHGENDDLVPPGEALSWDENNFKGPLRKVIIPSAEHDLFRDANAKLALDIIMRSVADVTEPMREDDEKIINRLSEIECEVNTFLASSPSSGPHLARSPSGKKLIKGKPTFTRFAVNEPILANIEITTNCNLKCKYCARSIWGRKGRNMSIYMFRSILDFLPHAYRVTLVGLGEPLLHPGIIDLVAMASSMGRRVAVVTNAMQLDKIMSIELIKAGLHSIAFSIDSPNQELADELRPGTDFNLVIQNIKEFIAASKEKRDISKAVFSAVSVKTVPYLDQLIDVVSNLGVNVLMLTDLNYKPNIDDTLSKNIDDNTATSVKKAVQYAFAKKLPVLTVRGLEGFGLADRYQDYLLFPPSQLYQRSTEHTWCFSPWQTMPVDVKGNVTICDCQPEKRIGNLFMQPLSEIWNGETMVQHRQNMTGDNPPEPCRICPRF